MADARPEEPPDVAPARREQPSCQRQHDPYVELPQSAQRARRRDAELQQRHRPAGPNDAGQLTKGRRGVVDVAEQVRDGQRVERGIGERQCLGAALAELEDAQRELLRMRFVEEMTQQQIAEALGTTQMQVSRLQRRILAQLAVAYEITVEAPETGKLPRGRSGPRPGLDA